MKTGMLMEKALKSGEISAQSTMTTFTFTEVILFKAKLMDLVFSNGLTVVTTLENSLMPKCMDWVKCLGLNPMVQSVFTKDNYLLTLFKVRESFRNQMEITIKVSFKTDCLMAMELIYGITKN